MEKIPGELKLVRGMTADERDATLEGSVGYEVVCEWQPRGMSSTDLDAIQSKGAYDSEHAFA